MSAEQLLTAALDSLCSDRREALQHSLGAWQLCRAPVIAEAVEALGALAAVYRTGIRRRGRESLHRAWLRTFAEGDILDVDLLLKHTTDGTRARSCERTACWLDSAPDPRIARRMGELLGGIAYYKLDIAVVLDVIVLQGDPRSRAAIEGRLPKAWGRQPPLLKAALAKLSAEPDVSTEVEGLAQAITARAQALLAEWKEDVAALEPLLAAIYAEPENTFHRMIYADRLAELGDPRGEFINLQLSRAPGTKPSQRERQLLRDYGDTWAELRNMWTYGGAPLLKKTGLEFAGGFVSGGRVGRVSADHVGTHREWATLRWLDIEMICDWPWMLFSDERHLQQLERLEGVSSWHLEVLSRRPIPVHTLIMGWVWRPDPPWEELRLIRAPRLSVLDLVPARAPLSVEVLGDFAQWPIAQTLEQLRGPIEDWAELPGLVACLFAAPALRQLTLETVVIPWDREPTPTQVRLVLDRDEDGFRAAAELIKERGLPAELALAEALEHLPPGTRV